MEKSHVTMEQHACMVCGRLFDTGAILLDRRLRPSFERHTTTGWGLCPEHTKLFDDGFLALVAIDESKSRRQPNGNYKPADVFRTGTIAHLKREAARNFFNVPIPDDLPMAFVEPGVIDALEQRVEK